MKMGEARSLQIDGDPEGPKRRRQEATCRRQVDQREGSLRFEADREIDAGVRGHPRGRPCILCVGHATQVDALSPNLRGRLAHPEGARGDVRAGGDPRRSAAAGAAGRPRAPDPVAGHRDSVAPRGERARGRSARAAMRSGTRTCRSTCSVEKGSKWSREGFPSPAACGGAADVNAPRRGRASDPATPHAFQSRRPKGCADREHRRCAGARPLSRAGRGRRARACPDAAPGGPRVPPSLARIARLNLRQAGSLRHGDAD